MRRISITNPSISNTYQTYLTIDYTSGTTARVASTTSFAANDFAVFGIPREENAELEQISSITAPSTLNLASALSFSHSKGTPVFRVVWDQVQIEGRASSAVAWTILTTSAIQWDNPNNQTVYYHSAGTNSWQYRFAFYNSSSVTYSEYSPTLSGTIPARTTVRYMLDQVRKIAGDVEGKIVGDLELIRQFNRAQDIIYAHNPKYWFLKVDTFETGSGSIAATANTDRYTLANLTNFGHLSHIKYRYNSGSNDIIYTLRKIDEAEFDRIDSDQNMTDDDWPTVYKLIPADSSSDNGYFKVTPDILTSNVGTFYPVYYEKMAELDSVDDITQVPLPELLVDFAIAYVFQVKGNAVKAKIYERTLVEDPDKKNPPLPIGLAQLDKLDSYQKKAVGQPQVLKVFKGHKAIKRLFGNRYSGLSQDYWRENYF